MRDIAVYEETNKGINPTTLFSKFVTEEFNIFIDQEITAEFASSLVVTLHYLNKKNPTKKITIYINSPGGSVSAGMMIYDYCQLISNPIQVYGFGTCASMGAFLLICLSKERYVSKNCEIMLHQPLMNGLGGQASDVEIAAKKILLIKEKINTIISECSNISKEEVEKLSDRDFWMDAQEAQSYGFIEGVLTKEKQ